MGDTENSLPSSKKRAAGRELTKDNPGLDDDDDAPEQETGTFKRASEEVLATRRIVKVRRKESTSAPSLNPFAGIQLVPPTESGASISEVPTDVQAISQKITSGNGDGKDVIAKENEKDKDEDEKQKESNTDLGSVAESEPSNKENVEGDKSSIVCEASKLETTDTVDNEAEDEDKKEDEAENVEPTKEGGAPPLSSFQQLSSSQNAFTGLAGTGFSTSTFSFGSIPKDGTTLGSGVALSNNGNSTLFGTSGTSIVSKSEGTGFPTMQEVSVETGEENERVVFSADSALFEFADGSWKERGKGELKVNVSTIGTEKARLLMRARGNYRLILNASLYPDMKLTNMDKRGITFACMNSTTEGKEGLSTVALKFKDGSVVEEFRAAVTAHKGKISSVLKTPENSPKASDD